ncbi:hypothetical protein [Collimonas sp.]|jgi:hypothetical protein|uniref:hypothetical protein n=1 Tax=Collimonas sp. TaxID=1963772 RepID=UPI002CA25155|nr:hypothetical protein [Collimonas sp.]HWX02847.1 hypothetical protein [Collimonas sp.]
MNLHKKIALSLSALLPLAACVPGASFAAANQQFSVSYDAQLTVDSKRASNTGMSQSAISALTGFMGGNVSVADVKDTVSFSQDSYQIQSVGTLGHVLGMFMSGSLQRTSVGKISGGTLNTLRYVDIRGSKAPLTTLVDEKSKTAFFYDGKNMTSRATFQSKPQDVLSLSYAFVGNVPSHPVSVTLSDGKSIKQATFDVHSESLSLPSGQWQAVKLTRRIASADDASVECWLRASDGVPLRVRIGMSQRYGAILDLKSTKVPAKVLPL